MLKELGILCAGIFVGAVGAELIRKSGPKFVNKVGQKTNQTITNLRKAFIAGYKDATHRQETVRPSA